MPTEPGTSMIRSALRARGITVLLPVVCPHGLDWAVDEGALHPPRRGVPGGHEPRTPRLGPDALEQAQVVLIPALAVDTLGQRLGQGGGYYDRALAHVHPAAQVAAVVHDDELLDAAVEPVPVEPHDRAVGNVLTPTRWMRFDPAIDVG
jgi:5-formyltetrahydrofolate cyclo-ligase